MLVIPSWLHLPIALAVLALVAVVALSYYVLQSVGMTFLSPAAEETVVVEERRGSSSKYVTVIINPTSGKGKASKIFESLKPVFRKAGIGFTVIETAHQGHATRIASQIPQQECDGIICVGGDGLVYEVLNGLLSRNDAALARHTPIGVIPAGTNNGLARSLGAHDPETAALMIVEGHTHSLDILSISTAESKDNSSKNSVITPGRTLYATLNVAWGLVGEVDQVRRRLWWLGSLKTRCSALFTVLTTWSVDRYTCKLSFLPLRSLDTHSQQCTGQQCEGCNKQHPVDKGKQPLTDLSNWELRHSGESGSAPGMVFFVAGKSQQNFPMAHLSDGYIDIRVGTGDGWLDSTKVLNQLVSQRSQVGDDEGASSHEQYFKTKEIQLEIPIGSGDIPLLVDGEEVDPETLTLTNNSPDLIRLHIEVLRGHCVVYC